MARLIIVCGLPGSGKTTLARRLEADLGAVRLTSDERMTELGLDLFDQEARARVEAAQQDLAEDLLRAGSTVVYEPGGWKRHERDSLRERARAAGAAVELRFLDLPMDALWERVQRRNAELPWGTAVIRQEDLAGWTALFEPPDAEELARYDPPER